MIIDIAHNVILKEAISERFEAAVSENLIPKLYSLFGEELIGVQMYEDHAKEDFTSDGFFYYPMTVLLKGGYTTVFVKWDISAKSEFIGGVPYSFVGKELDFIIASDTPEHIAEAMVGRANYFEGGTVKLNVTTTAGSVSFLTGKFSQSFMDELARQITKEISNMCGVTGLASSTIELDMVFSPESYMEHTSENVTYRRLLMSAKGCAPRDFWIKWRGKDGVAHSCSDEVSSANIEFSLGEDVPHKAREKEYRYLVRGNSDKYRTAMGKKNITEWRELIKRAVKRGELERTVSDNETRQHSEEVADKVAEILERFNISVPESGKESGSVGSDDIASIAREKLRGFGTSVTEDEDNGEFFIPEEALGDSGEYAEPADELLGSLVIAKPEEATASEDVERVSTPVGAYGIPVPDSTPISAPIPEMAQNEARTAEGGDILRSRLREETYARAEAEEKLRDLNERLDTLRSENAALLAAIESSRAELAAVTAQLELEAKERAREKALFAEAARQAKEENERLSKEREAEEARRLLEEARREEARIIEEARAKEEEERISELERIERNIRERENEKRNALQRAAELRSKMEKDALMRVREMGFTERVTQSASVSDTEGVHGIAVAEEHSDEAVTAPEPISPENHPYTSVTAKLMFRHNVDPNVKSRLYEIISLGLEYFKKEHVYIKLKASIPEPSVVLLDFAEFPEGEEELLRGIVKLIGNSDLGVTKIIVE